MTSMILLEVVGIGPPQRGNLKQSTGLDAQPPHNLCFCPEIDWLDNLPSHQEKFNKLGKFLELLPLSIKED